MDLSIYIKEDKIIVYLNGYQVEDDMINEYKDLLWKLVKDAQTELKQK